MRTDELIEMLGTNVEPVKSDRLRSALLAALAAGGAVAACLMVAALGLPAGAPDAEQIALTAAALVFTLGLVAAGASFLIRAARPGTPADKPLVVVGLLFIAVIAAGIAALLAHPVAWRGMVFGNQWTTCLFCIPLFAIAPFAALIWALRYGAPTNLVRTGAVAGLVAGASGAAVMAFHHAGGSIPFIALWYGGPIIMCALAGAALGPRLLRW